MGNCPCRWMRHKLANGMKARKRAGKTTTLFSSLNGILEYIMVLPEVKYCGTKLVPRSDLRVGILQGESPPILTSERVT
jgi:hypothetical protein